MAGEYEITMINKNMNKLLEGRTIVKYESRHESCDNEHLIYLDSGDILVLGHEDNEGFVLIVDGKIYKKLGDEK